VIKAAKIADAPASLAKYGSHWRDVVAVGAQRCINLGVLARGVQQMVTLSSARLAVAVGGLALSLTGGAGVASADPDLDPIVNTTCNYSQVMAALNAADPIAAAAFNSDAANQSFLRQFLNSPPSRRRAMAQQIASAPGAEPQFGLIQQVFATCNNY
jgi:hemophore-related protein